MIVSKKGRHYAGFLAMACAGVALGTVASQANAANTYFDTNGTTAGYGVANGGTYSWEGAYWATATGGTSATSAYVAGSFPRFNGGASGNSYTVTVSADESIAGMFQTVNGVNMTINATGSGDLNMASGLQGVLNGGSSSTLTINAPIVGSGGLEPENGGSIKLNGLNTYSGGTTLGNTATLTYFDNASSFGTGTITMGVAGFAPLLGQGGATITLANRFTSTVTGAGINFAADANTPVVSTGTWSLGADNLVLRNNGVASSPLTISGVISGTAGVSLSANNSGTIEFGGTNTYSGTTTVGVGSTAVILKLVKTNAIAHTSQVIMAGGILDPGGLTQNMGSSTFSLTAASTLDYEAGASEVDFKDSHSIAWTGPTLNLKNWDPTTDKLRFGTDSSGLTSTQLAMIEFDGAGLGTASLDANGYVVVPEPTSLGLLAGASLLAIRRRRRAAK